MLTAPGDLRDCGIARTRPHRRAACTSSTKSKVGAGHRRERQPPASPGSAPASRATRSPSGSRHRCRGGARRGRRPRPRPRCSCPTPLGPSIAMTMSPPGLLESGPRHGRGARSRRPRPTRRRVAATAAAMAMPVIARRRRPTGTERSPRRRRIHRRWPRPRRRGRVAGHGGGDAVGLLGPQLAGVAHHRVAPSATAASSATSGSSSRVATARSPPTTGARVRTAEHASRRRPGRRGPSPVSRSLHRGAHRLEDVEEPGPARVERHAGRRDRPPGEHAAAAHRKAADDGSPRNGEIQRWHRPRDASVKPARRCDDARGRAPPASARCGRGSPGASRWW